MRPAFVVLILTFAFALPAWSEDLESKLLAMEERLGAAWGERDGETFGALVTEDMVEIAIADGRLLGREAVIEMVVSGHCAVKSFEIDDVEVRRLTDDVALIAYVVTQDTVCRGEPLPKRIHAMSIYVRRDGAWRAATYQETPVRPSD
jgi:uncharacterized protein (TIGR02246 family)